MNVIVIMLVGIGALSLLRIVTQWRKVSRPVEKDWDARFIGQLRKAGIAPFEAYPVDFFFDLPSEQACREVAAVLEPEGYAVESRAEAETGRYSLHASHTMRLLVPDMQALTARFNQLAGEKGGKYDGWAVAKGPSRRQG